MAITRTQIAKQLLANGGRIGFRVGGGRGGTGYGRGARTSEERADTGMARGRGPGGTIGGGPNIGVSLHGGDKPKKIITSSSGNGDKKVSPIEKFNAFQKQKFTPLRKNTLRNLIDYIGGGRKFQYPTASIFRDLTGKGLKMDVSDYEGLENVSPLQLQAMFGKDIIGTADEEKIRDISRVLGQDVVSQSDFEQFYPDKTLTGDGSNDPCDGPNPPAYCFTGIRSAAIEPEIEPEEQEPFELARAFRAEGGIMDGNIDEMGRQMYGLGKLVKKVTRGIKKIVKSPIGKAALLGLGAKGILGGTGISKFLLGAKPFKYGVPFSSVLQSSSGTPGLLGKLGLTKGAGSFMPTALGGIGLASLASGLMTKQTEEDEEDELYRGEGLDFASLRPYGIQRFAEGGKPEPVAKKTMPLLNMGGMEKDYREDGGFVPIGRMEKADDVPARLSKNEFVFTADAVRNAGDGNVDKGAEVMYNMMKNLESGGDVSKESQGLEGARKMFQTSQRLEEVL